MCTCLCLLSQMNQPIAKKIRTNLMFTDALTAAMRENCLTLNLTSSDNFTQGIEELTADYIEMVQRSRLPGRRFAKVVKIDPDVHKKMKEKANALQVSMSDVGEACIRYLNEMITKSDSKAESVSQPLIKSLPTKNLIIELEQRGYDVSPKNTR